LNYFKNFIFFPISTSFFFLFSLQILLLWRLPGVIPRSKQFKPPQQHPSGTLHARSTHTFLARRIDACIFTEENVQRSADFFKKSVFWGEKDRIQKNQEQRTED